MSVVNEFNQKAGEYDDERRALIPCFDDFYGIAIDCIDFEGDNPKVLDLGAGTGILSQFLLNKYPNAEITLIDLADKMLNEAKKRFEGNDNVYFVCDDYLNHEFDTKFDIVISSLSIHHLTGDDKKLLIEKYVDLLNDGGNFVNADQVLNPFPEVEEYFKVKLDEHKGDISDEAYEEAKLRRTYDKPSSVDFQVDCLKNAGCQYIGIPYKYYMFAVFWAKK
ncbi:class I SAM-dependent methyltransferase [uncultured Methanobrevibacter sp.]|uniref:class I SAM-dependent methyltransferase n=1 Tax=uncultured Methanobrevibacter sp. TaxID=253161 RepID=UPI0026358A56|nr:class I SAM-dependent methyltransferase [uncultured Methanobrevibacter sp.]